MLVTAANLLPGEAVEWRREAIAHFELWRLWTGQFCHWSLPHLAGNLAAVVAIGVIATPAEAAQSVADLLVAAGVTSILNLSAVHLSTPDSVVVRPVDLATEIQILAVHAAHGAGR